MKKKGKSSKPRPLPQLSSAALTSLPGLSTDDGGGAVPAFSAGAPMGAGANPGGGTTNPSGVPGYANGGCVKCGYEGGGRVSNQTFNNLPGNARSYGK